MQEEKDRNSFKTIGDYVVTRKIGQGAYGVVKEGFHSKTGNKVALKIIEPKSNSANPKYFQYLEREINIMKKLHHENIVQLIEVIEVNSEKTCLVLEFVDGGDLFEHIATKGKLPEHEAARFLSQMVSAVSHCHNLNVIHRDLKPENILLDSTRQNVKITDFGVSNMAEPGKFLQTKCGSPFYAAPELLTQEQYSGPEVDVWSLGVILYTMATGCFPWAGSTMMEQVTNSIRANYVPPEDVSPECEDLIRCMLVKDPQRRANLSEVMDHPWMIKNLPTPTKPSSDDSSQAIITPAVLPQAGASEEQTSLPTTTKKKSFFAKLFQKQPKFKAPEVEADLESKMKRLGISYKKKRQEELQYECKLSEIEVQFQVKVRKHGNTVSAAVTKKKGRDSSLNNVLNMLNLESPREM